MSGLPGLLLPLGIGAAISPISTAICSMLLGAGRNRIANTVAYLVGNNAVKAGGVEKEEALKMPTYVPSLFDCVDRSEGIRNVEDTVHSGTRAIPRERAPPGRAHGVVRRLWRGSSTGTCGSLGDIVAP